VFLINSCLGLFTATWSPRYPFSRTYEANLPSSLTTLLPLVLGFSPHPPVSVYGTGTITLNSSFSRQCGIISFGTFFPSPSGLQIIRRFCLPDFLSPLDELYLQFASIILLRPHFSHTSNSSTGISTCYPSTTPLGLALGPDLPWEDEPSPGNLGFSTVKILTSLSLLIPAFSLLFRPHILSVMLLPTIVRSPTTFSCLKLRYVV
jgi:hypothetical protein